jgi:hypothetical protein
MSPADARSILANYLAYLRLERHTQPFTNDEICAALTIAVNALPEPTTEVIP